MRKSTIYYKKIISTYIHITGIALFLCMLVVKGFTPFQETGDNFFHVFMNGEEIGVVGDAKRAEELFVEARRTIAMESEELTFCDAELTLEGEEVLFGRVDSEKEILAKMEECMRDYTTGIYH